MDEMNYFNQDAEKGVDTKVVNKVMRNVYFKMCMAMLVSAVTAMHVSTDQAILEFVFGKPAVLIGLVIAQVAVVIVMSSMLSKLGKGVATVLFLLYSILTGVTLSTVLLVYTSSSVVYTFIITAVVFAVMCVYGYITENDLSKFGSIMFMALIGLIICAVVNIFMKSVMMDWIISFAGVIIFIGLTAWDTQAIKRMIASSSEDSRDKIATIGALNLYLDFVNLFLYLLRFFGGRR